MSGIAVIFTPEGTGRTLHTEAINLAAIGRLVIERATTIEFDNDSQCWCVRDQHGLPLLSNPSRQHCLDWERQHLDVCETAKHGGCT